MRPCPPKREWDVLPCTVPFSFFLSSTTSTSRPIAKFLVTICSKSCPSHRKAPWMYCLCTVPGVFYGWNNLCIPACLKFNYKMFIPTSLGRRLFGPAHKKRVRRTTMYSPALFFMSSSTYASRPITKFLITICSKSCPNHPKAPWTYCLCTVPGVF